MAFKLYSLHFKLIVPEVAKDILNSRHKMSVQLSRKVRMKVKHG